MEQESNKEFIAKESKVINIIFGVFFLVLFLAAYSNVSFNSSAKNIAAIVGSIAVPAILFWANAAKKKPVFVINQNGLFYHKHLITNWDNFNSAYIDALPTRGHAPDQFVLIIYYCNPTDNKVYQVSLKIPISLNKSHEEIMNAIKKYSNVIVEQKDE